MLVAEKEQYTDLLPPKVEVGQPISVPRTQAVPKTKSRARKMISHIALIIIGFAICSCTVAGYAIIAQKQQEIIELGKILRSNDYPGDMRLELASRGNLEQIEEIAKNNLRWIIPIGSDPSCRAAKGYRHD